MLESQRVARARRWKSLWLGALLLAITLLAFAPAILHGGYVWDDDVHLTRNPMIFSPDGLSVIWSQVTWRVEFYPLTFTSFWLQYRVNGLNPLPYHLVNVVIHGINAMLVWGIAKRLKLRGAFWVAIIFAVHPLNVESVAWVTERKNVLMGFFYFLAVLAYLRFEPGATGRRNWWFYAAAFASFVLALLSKTVCCTLPAGMAVILWWRDGSLSRRRILPLIPMLVVGLTFAVGTAYLEKAVVGSVGDAWQYSLVDRMLIAGRAVCFYLAKFLWPQGLCFSYPLWHIDAAKAWQYIFPLVVLGVLAFLWMWRSRLGRGPLTGSLFFLITISPALGFVSYYTMIYSLVADHYVYIAILGLICIAVEMLYGMVGKVLPAGVRTVVLVTWAVVLAMLSFQRSQAYQDAATLWRDTLAKNPQSWLAHTSLGVELRHEGRPEEAMAEFRSALTINPNCYQAMNDIGTMLADAGSLEEAAPYFERIIHDRPAYSAPYGNLASIRLREGRLGEAGALYEQAVRLDPYDHDARFNYGRLLANNGQFGRAAQLFQEASALDPCDAASQLFWGECLASLGQLEAAGRHLEKAVELRPGWSEAQDDLRKLRAAMGH